MLFQLLNGGASGIQFSKPILIATVLMLAAMILLLYVFVLITRAARANRKRREKEISADLRPLLDAALLSGAEQDFDRLYSHTKAVPLGYTEEMIMDILTAPMSTKVEHALQIARHFGFPGKALRLFNSRSLANIAMACRKSGVYRNKASTAYILKVLRVPSSVVQFQAITALSLIGDLDSFIQGIEVIQRYIMLNERTLFEIIRIYEGNKLALFKKMVSHQVDYIAAIFLKSIDANLADGLKGEVLSQLESANTERLIAAIKAASFIKEEKVAERLKGFINDTRWQVRAAVVKSLGNYTQCDLVGDLKDALSDPNWWVRTNAAQSLIQFDDVAPAIRDIIHGGDKFAKECLANAIRAKHDMDLTMLLEKAEKE